MNAAISPSLVSGRPDVHAHEIKFLVSRDVAGKVLEWARPRLETDPHSRPEAGGGYSISSLYLDTPKFAVYHKLGSFGRAKFRIRRYGVSDRVFVERKLKVGGRVSKRRSELSAKELARLERGELVEDGWAARWYEKRMKLRDLRVVCQISYERIALIGVNEEGPLRLTLDEAVHVARQDRPNFAEPGTGQLILQDHMILELKYRGAMPAIFKELAQHLPLEQGSVSKYRLGLACLGCVTPEAQTVPATNGAASEHHA